MSNDRPTAEELRQGLTVEIGQEDTNIAIASEAELKNGVVGHVQSVVADE